MSKFEVSNIEIINTGRGLKLFKRIEMVWLLDSSETEKLPRKPSIILNFKQLAIAMCNQRLFLYQLKWYVPN